jgi:hypothetical protein
MDIEIKTIAAAKQRYETVGDWYDVTKAYPTIGDEPDHRTVIVVSKFPDEKHEFLIALHEMVEMYLCHARGITVKMVDEFDFGWKGDGEPGDDPAAPYCREHQFASVIERMMAHELGVDWEEYEKQIEAVSKGE